MNTRERIARALEDLLHIRIEMAAECPDCEDSWHCCEVHRKTFSQLLDGENALRNAAQLRDRTVKDECIVCGRKAETRYGRCADCTREMQWEER